MRRPVLVLLTTWVVAASFSIFSCSSFSEEAANGDDAGSPEAAPADVVVAEDASDAGADAGFCAQHADAELCADFDEGRSLETGFTYHQGTASLDLDASVSPPGSLRVTGGSDAVSVQYTPGNTLPQTAEQRLELDVLLEGYPAAATDPKVAVFAGIMPDGDGCIFALEYLTTGTRLAVADTNGSKPIYTNLPFKAHPALGKWSHVELSLVTGTDGLVQASARVDGVSALDPVYAGCPSLAGKPDVFLGLYSMTPAAVHYDNVLFERH